MKRHVKFYGDPVAAKRVFPFAKSRLEALKKKLRKRGSKHGQQRVLNYAGDLEIHLSVNFPANQESILIYAVADYPSSFDGLLHMVSNVTWNNGKRLFPATGRPRNWTPWRAWDWAVVPPTVAPIDNAVLNSLTGVDRDTYKFDGGWMVWNRPTMYSGKMRKVISKNFGRYLKISDRFKHDYDGTHGIFTPDPLKPGIDQQRWVIEIGATGVFAWPIDFDDERPEGFQVSKESIETTDTYDFGLPALPTIPTTTVANADLITSSDHRIELLGSSAMASPYANSRLPITAPVGSTSSALGWAYSYSGHEAQVVKRYREVVTDSWPSIPPFTFDWEYNYMQRWKITIAQDGKGRPVSASLQLMDDGYFYGPDKDSRPVVNVQKLNYWAYSVIPYHSPHSTPLFRPPDGNGTYPDNVKNVPMHVFYRGEEEVIARYHYEPGNETLARSKYPEGTWWDRPLDPWVDSVDGARTWPVWSSPTKLASWDGNHYFKRDLVNPQRVQGFLTPAAGIAEGKAVRREEEGWYEVKWDVVVEQTAFHDEVQQNLDQGDFENPSGFFYDSITDPTDPPVPGVKGYTSDAWTTYLRDTAVRIEVQYTRDLRTIDERETHALWLMKEEIEGFFHVLWKENRITTTGAGGNSLTKLYGAHAAHDNKVQYAMVNEASSARYYKPTIPPGYPAQTIYDHTESWIGHDETSAKIGDPNSNWYSIWDLPPLSHLEGDVAEVYWVFGNNSDQVVKVHEQPYPWDGGFVVDHRTINITSELLTAKGMNGVFVENGYYLMADIVGGALEADDTLRVTNMAYPKSGLESNTYMSTWIGVETPSPLT